MATQHYDATNVLMHQLSLTIDRETNRQAIHELVTNICRAINEERQVLQAELSNLKTEIGIKGYYIKELEKVKGLPSKPRGQQLEKREHELIRIMTITTDTLDSVISLRSTH
jgi:ribosome-binding protein aMBF1 (putative translation factor)